ncbi:DUF1499 domain-containing protein [Marinobacter fuscus]|uniref:DUF1499 domain-containing protein n=1 Tax=Marinobacter fuscus TaxID=2109942 RepID=A0A2T1KQ35_9GAMM|nr:DUF1499 domain-containing protein [Marinobacter fuscus]PSF12148.1 DUF1499 domain-containing protein [Marinobacter fuscus]
MRNIIIALSTLWLAGCSATENVPPTGTRFTLDGCPPFMNCVSTSATESQHAINPIRLREPLNESSWAIIKAEALTLPGASLNHVRFGYANITCYSDIFGFPDYLEILVDPEQLQLNVRSQSRLGFADMGVNRDRVERLRSRLVARGIAAE